MFGTKFAHVIEHAGPKIHTLYMYFPDFHFLDLIVSHSLGLLTK